MGQTWYKVEAHEFAYFFLAHFSDDRFEQFSIAERTYARIVISLKPNDFAAAGAEGGPICTLASTMFESSWILSLSLPGSRICKRSFRQLYRTHADHSDLDERHISSWIPRISPDDLSMCRNFELPDRYTPGFLMTLAQ